MKRRRRALSFGLNECVSRSDYDFEVDLFVTVTPGYPARMDGPREDCYPGEDDRVEIDHAFVWPASPSEGPPRPMFGKAFIDWAGASELDRLADAAREEFRFYSEVDDDEPDRDEA